MKKDDLMKHISTNKQGVKKRLRQMRRKEHTRNKPTVMGKNIKPAIGRLSDSLQTSLNVGFNEQSSTL